MKKIVFYSHAHRGDICISRPFIEHIIEKIDADYYYAHFWEKYILRDMRLKYIDIDSVDILSDKRHVGNFEHEDIIYINTWIGNYFSHSKPGYGECTLQSTYDLMYTEIFDFLKNTSKSDISLKNILEYFPSIDYSYFKIDKIDEFIKVNDNRKIILFCNGPSLSGQCEYNGDMKEIIQSLSEKYNDMMFITTHKIDVSNKNVKYTGDIIQSNECDLNEIAYLSKFCNLIIGRSSGPFIYTNIKENIFDESKTFLCFGKRVTDCLPYKLDIECEFIFELFSNLTNLQNTITDLIENEKTL
jgi:ADP-heptose:LPS heptosyltransferase